MIGLSAMIVPIKSTKAIVPRDAVFLATFAVVAAALLFQSVFASPLLFGAFGHHLGGLGPFALLAVAFKAMAFAVFLYLSVQ